MKTQYLRNQSGFTLIETLIAMAIFTIGILGLFGMQTSAIKENLSANNITIGSTWAAEQTEQLVSRRYTDSLLNITSTCSTTLTTPPQLPNIEDSQNTLLSKLKNLPVANKRTLATAQVIYTIYWAVANDCLLSTIPNAASQQQEQKPKLLRIFVTTTSGNGQEKLVSGFSYIKQNTQIGP